MILLASCEKEFHQHQEPVINKTESFAKGEANVLFCEETVSKIEDGTVSPSYLGLITLERLFPYSEQFEERKRREGLHRWYKVSYDISGPDTKSKDGIDGLEGVEEFVPVRNARLASYFNDPKAINQWHYMNDGTTSSQFAAGADINVETVWQDYTTGDRSVIVAVIDQGVDYTHEDLAANYIGGYNFVTDGKITADDHGTHVAGTIAAVNNNGIGVSGIAGGDAAKGVSGVGILSCQIFSGSKSTQHGPEALVWAADNGAVIANNSWGYVFQDSEASKKAVIDADLKAAIDYFIKYAGCDNDGNQLPDSPMKGGVVIFAAGNDSWDSNPICAYDPVISVGAIGPNYSRAYYSNYGEWVDIAAPGGTAKVSSGQILSTVASGKYSTMQGTSMACPHVSGVAALIVSYHGGPGFTNDMLKERLLGGTRKDVLPLDAKIGPLVDALGSITYGGTTAPESVSHYDVNIIGNTLTITLNVTEDRDDVKAYEYLVVVTPASISIPDIDIDALPEEAFLYRFRTGAAEVGKAINLVIQDLAFETEYDLHLAGRDYAGNVSQWSEIKRINTEANNPPVISPEQGYQKIVLKAQESVSIPFHIYDPEGGELTVTLSKGMSGAAIKRVEGNVWTFSVTGSIANPGVYTGEITATDTGNLTSIYKVEYEILRNSAPEVVRQISDILTFTAGEKFEFDLNEYFSDSDGETLSYKVTEGNRNVAKASVEGSRLIVNSVGFGSTSVTVTAADARKATADLVIRIVVKNVSNMLEIYPVPVETVVNIKTGEPKPTDIAILTMNGQTVIEEKGKTVSAFDPAVIDMTDCAPGRYKVRVIIDDKTYDRVITKI